MAEDHGSDKEEPVPEVEPGVGLIDRVSRFFPSLEREDRVDLLKRVEGGARPDVTPS